MKTPQLSLKAKKFLERNPTSVDSEQRQLTGHTPRKSIADRLATSFIDTLQLPVGCDRSKLSVRDDRKHKQACLSIVQGDFVIAEVYRDDLASIFAAAPALLEAAKATLAWIEEYAPNFGNRDKMESSLRAAIKQAQLDLE